MYIYIYIHMYMVSHNGHLKNKKKKHIQAGNKQSKTICKPITQHYLKLYIVNITKLKWQSTFLLFNIAMEHHHF